MHQGIPVSCFRCALRAKSPVLPKFKRQPELIYLIMIFRIVRGFNQAKLSVRCYYRRINLNDNFLFYLHYLSGSFPSNSSRLVWQKDGSCSGAVYHILTDCPYTHAVPNVRIFPSQVSSGDYYGKHLREMIDSSRIQMIVKHDTIVSY